MATLNGVHRPDITVNDFVKSAFAYKKLLRKMTAVSNGLESRRRRAAGRLDRYQSAEMITEMEKSFPAAIYRRHLKYVLDFLESYGSTQFSAFVARLGLTFDEAEGVEKMFEKGGYTITLDKTIFDTSTTKTSTSGAQATATAAISHPTAKPSSSGAQAAAIAAISHPTAKPSSSGAQAAATAAISHPTAKPSSSGAQAAATAAISHPTAKPSSSGAQAAATAAISHPTAKLSSSGAQAAATAAISHPTAKPSTSGAQAAAVAASSHSAVFEIPRHWSSKENELGHVKVQLSPDSEEFKEVLAKIRPTNSSNRIITKISRIENTRLYLQYQVQKQSVAQSCPPGIVIKRQLFHGTRQKNVESILSGGFDRSFAGQAAGTSLGAGNYFSTSFHYSSNRRLAADGNVLLCRVIVGQSFKGHQDMRVPPFKKGGPDGVRYESLVDFVSNPRTYVVFPDASAYPEYLLEFKQD